MRDLLALAVALLPAAATATVDVDWRLVETPCPDGLCFVGTDVADDEQRARTGAMNHARRLVVDYLGQHIQTAVRDDVRLGRGLDKLRADRVFARGVTAHSSGVARYVEALDWKVDRRADGKVEAWVRARVRQSDLDAAKKVVAEAARAVADLDPRTLAAARQLAAPRQRLVVGLVVIDGVAGGARAVWLRSVMEGALVSVGAVAIDAAVAKPGDARLSAVALRHLAGSGPTLSVRWRRVDAEGEVRTADPIDVPDLVLPFEAVVEKRGRAFESEALEFELDAGPGGRLCPGDAYTLRFSARERYHVRVINLFEGGALTLPAGSLGPGAPLELRLVAAPNPGGGPEEFFVVAAADRAGLGWLGVLPDRCRLTPSQRERLLGGDLPTGVHALRRGVRVLDAAECPPSAGVVDAALAADVLADTRWCPQ